MKNGIMKLVIIGAGGHGQSVFEIARSLKKYITSTGSDNIIFLDDRYVNNEKQIYGTISYKIAGVCSDYKKYINREVEFYPAFGDNRKRLEMGKEIIKFGGKLATIIHPSAYVAESVTIGDGTVIFPNAMINSGCSIGKLCIINLGAIIDHGCIINDGCHINSGAIVMAENIINKCMKIDSGQIIKFREHNKSEIHDVWILYIN